MTEVRAASIDGRELRQWITNMPQIAVHLLPLLARRARHLDSALTDLITDNVSGRLATVLLDLAEQFGTEKRGMLVVTHDLTQREIAQMIGAARKTVNETLADFTRRGWLLRGDKSVLILDPTALASRAR
nr:hypothetical protein GCM10017745_46520 [Saccharothrix mutabilis subsp. capreolus]